MASQAPTNANRYYWIDWLRFGAAFEVLIYHVRHAQFVAFGALDPTDRNWLVALVFSVSRLGPEAVVLFFVLSGYLVGGRSLQRWRAGAFRAGPYFLDRATRIYTPLVPTLCLTALVMLVYGQSPQVTDFVVNLLGLQGVAGNIGVFGGNAPLWSLAYEIWFYLLWGCALLLCSNSSTRSKLFSASVVLSSFFVFTRLDVTYLFCWLVGVVAHQLGTIPQRARAVAVAVAVILLGVVLTQVNGGSVSVEFGQWQEAILSKAWSTLILAAGFGLFLHCVSGWKPVAGRTQWFERLGTPLANLSYTLYLTHAVSLGFWMHFNQVEQSKVVDAISMFAFGLNVAVPLGVSWILYYCFERRTAEVRGWLRERLRVPRDVV